VACFALWSPPALAQVASLPWLPDDVTRHDLELLVDDAGLELPVTQWPLPTAAVRRALDRLPPALPDALNAARERVVRALGVETGAALQATVRNQVDTLSGYGDDATPGSYLALRSETVDTGGLAWRFGGRIQSMPDPTQPGAQGRLDEAAAAVEGGGTLFQAWARRSWWGPGWQSSLILGNNSPALLGVGIQRASTTRSASPWLSWMGPWTGEFFIAHTEDDIAPENPLLVGMRLTFRPFQSLEIGLTRTAQWGGEGRPDSLSSFVDMLFARGTNASTKGGQANDPANEMAGFDLRLRCPAGLHCAAYTQWIGEDEAGYLPTKYLGLLGLESWTADGEHRFFLEGTETGCRESFAGPDHADCAYRNYIYHGGYTDARRWMGASIGPDSWLATFGWMSVAWNSLVRVHVGRVGGQIGTFVPLDHGPTAGDLIGLSARRGFDWHGMTLTPQVDADRIRSGTGQHNDFRFGLSLDVPLGTSAGGGALAVH
jgi:hypothetical protein